MAKKVRVMVIRVPREKFVVPVGTTPRGLKDFAIVESAFPASGIGVAIMLNRVCVAERCPINKIFLIIAGRQSRNPGIGGGRFFSHGIYL
jgi:hypothetical protein